MSVPFGQALQFHWRHMALGLAVGLVCWEASPDVVAWMSPVLLGLVLAAPLTWLTSRPAGPLVALVLSTPEDRCPPAILVRADRQARAWAERIAELSRPRPEPVPELPRAA